MGFGVWSLEFGVWVWGLGCGVWGLRVCVCCPASGVVVPPASGLRVQGLGFGVYRGASLIRKRPAPPGAP